MRLVATFVALALFATGCSAPATSSSTTATAPTSAATSLPSLSTMAAPCPDVLDVVVEQQADSTYTFSVTLRSDDSQEVYADRWEVVAPDGTVLATRVLTHAHIDEQPFTRSLSGVVIPDGITKVMVRAGMRGYPSCGGELTTSLP